MKPLLLANRGFTIGGGEVGLELLVSGLLKRSVEPRVVVPTPGPLLESLPVDRRVSNPRDLESDLRDAARGRSVVHTYSVGGYAAARAAGLGLPLVLHALVPNRMPQDAAIAAGADAIVCNSHSTARRFDGSANVRVVYNGVARPNPVGPSESIADPALKTVALIGPASVRKGHLDALPALIELVERRGDVEVLFVGRMHGAAGFRVRSAIAAHARIRAVGFVPGTANHMPWFDLVVVPSVSEGFGRVAVEALRAGVPVLARPVEGLVEALEGLDDPWLPESTDAWADRIEAELDRPKHSVEELRSFGDRFAVGSWVDGILDVWHEVAS